MNTFPPSLITAGIAALLFVPLAGQLNQYYQQTAEDSYAAFKKEFGGTRSDFRKYIIALWFFTALTGIIMTGALCAFIKTCTWAS
jgi:hypothetical protein